MDYYRPTVPTVYSITFHIIDVTRADVNSRPVIAFDPLPFFFSSDSRMPFLMDEDKSFMEPRHLSGSNGNRLIGL